MILHTAVLVAALLLGKLRVATCLVYDPVEYKDFCPKNVCSPPSSHYVCKYFDSEKPKEKRTCVDFPNLTELTEKNVATIVNDINRYRTDLAQGLAVKKGGEPIPRGYGIMRMSWDRQLAGLAKFYTETCMGSKTCASTRRFPKVTFVSYGRLMTTQATSDVSATLLDFNIDYALTNYEDPRGYYVSMLGDAKYLGCAVYWKHIHVKLKTITYTFQTNMVCYLSHHVEFGELTYNTTPPQLETGFTNKCGCPLFHREVEGCLCEYYAPHTLSTPPMYILPKYANKRLRGPAEPRRRALGGGRQRERRPRRTPTTIIH